MRNASFIGLLLAISVAFSLLASYTNQPAWHTVWWACTVYVYSCAVALIFGVMTVIAVVKASCYIQNSGD